MKEAAIIDLGTEPSKYAEIAESLLGKDPREKSELDLGEINAVSYLTELCETYKFPRIGAIMDNFLHYRMSLKRKSREETVDVFRSLMRERPDFKGMGDEEEMLK